MKNPVEVLVKSYSSPVPNCAFQPHGFKVSIVGLLCSLALGHLGSAQLVSPITQDQSLSSGTTTVSDVLEISPGVRVTVTDRHTLVGAGTIKLLGGNTILINQGVRLVLLTNLLSEGDSFISGGDIGLYTFKSPKQLNIASGNLDVSTSLDGWYFGGFRKQGAGTLTLRSSDNENYFVGINEGTFRVAQGGALSAGSLFGTPQGTLQIDAGGLGVVSVSSNYTGRLVGSGSLWMYGRALAKEGNFNSISDEPVPQTVVTLSGDNSQFTGTYGFAAGTLALQGAALSGTTAGVLFANNANAALSIKGGTLRTKSLVTDGLKIPDPNVAPYFDGSLPSGQYIRAGGGLSGTLEVNLASGVTNRFDGKFENGEGTLSVVKSGAGTLVLGGTSENYYTGSTTVNAGELRFATTNGLRGPLVMDGGSVSIEAGSGLRFYSGTAQLISTGGGRISGGTLAMYNSKPLNVSVGSGTLEINSVIDAWYFSGLKKTGVGTLSLSNPNDYNVAYSMEVNQGAVRLSNRMDVGTLTGSAQGTLVVEGGLSLASRSDYQGRLAGAGTLFLMAKEFIDPVLGSDGLYHMGDKPLPGTVMTLSGDLSGFSGMLALASGTLALVGTPEVSVSNVAFFSKGNSTLSIGGTLRTAGISSALSHPDVNENLQTLTPKHEIRAAGTDATGAQFEVNLANGVTNQFNGNFADGDGYLTLKKTGPGRLVLGGTVRNSNTMTEVAGGVLQFGTDNRVVGLDVYDGGAVEISAGRTLEVGGESRYGYAALWVGGQNSISGGTLKFVDDMSYVYSDSGNLTVNSTIAGTGSLLKEGSGALTFSQPATFSSIELTQGSLVLNGTSTINRLSTLVLSGGSLLIRNNLNHRLEELEVSGGSSFSTSGGGEFKVGGSLIIGSQATVNVNNTGSEFVFGSVVGSGGTINVAPGAVFNGDANGRPYGAPVGAHTLNLRGGQVRDAEIAEGATVNLGGSGAAGSTSQISLVSVLARPTAKLFSPVELTVPQQVDDGIDFGTASLGRLSGAFKLTKSGLGTLAVLNASPDFTGELAVAEGTLFATDILTGRRTVTVSSGALLTDTRNESGAFSGTLSGAGSVRLASQSIDGLDESRNLLFTPNLAVTLTLNDGASVSSKMEIGENVTLVVGTGASVSSALNVTAGSLNLVDASKSLNAGANVTLGAGARLTLSGAGTVAVPISGSGTLVKTGPGSLVLSNAGVLTGETRVLSGSLTAGNILSGTRKVEISAGATLASTVNAGTYSGSFKNDGVFNLSITGTKLTLASSSPLVGTVNLAAGVLDAQNTGSAFLANGNLSIGSTGTLILGGSSQELELTTLSLSLGAKIQANGAVIYYDTLPSFLNENNQVIEGAGNFTGVTFNVLTKGGTIAGSGSSTVPNSHDYRFTAGRIALKGQGPLWGGTLFLEPEKSTSNLRLVNSGTFSSGIVASGTGFVTIGNLVTTPSLAIGPSIVTTLTPEGVLSAAGGARIRNNGTLLLSVLAGSKTVDSLFEGTGVTRKVDGGTLVLSRGWEAAASGSLSVEAGVLQTDTLPSAASSVVTLNGGELALGRDVSTASLVLVGGAVSGGVTVTGTTGFDLRNGTVSVSLSGDLLKTTPGTVVLNRANNGGGSVSIQEGVLRLSLDNAFASSDAPLVVSGGELALQRTRQSFARVQLTGGLVSGGTLESDTFELQSGSISSALTGSGTVVKEGMGTVVLLGDNSLSGTMHVNAGTLTLGGTAKITTGTVVINGGALRLNNTDQRVDRLSISSGSAFAKSGTAEFKADVVDLGVASKLSVQSGQLVFGAINGLGGIVEIIAGGTLNGDRNGRANGAPIAGQTIHFRGGGLTDADIQGDVTLNLGSGAATGTALLGFGQNRIGAAAVLRQDVELRALGETTLRRLEGGSAVTKSGEGALTILEDSQSFTGPVTVAAGALTATNLLTGNRSVTLGAAGTLNLTLTAGTTYSGTMSGKGTTFITGPEPVTLGLSAGGKLDGVLNFVSSGFTLNTVNGGTNVFGDSASLNFMNGGSLVFGNTQELELQSISVKGGTLTLSSNGGQILYDQQPAFLTDSGSFIAGKGVVLNGAVGFDVLTKLGTISGGTYQYLAGRVRDKTLPAGTMLTGTVLQLDPMRESTKVRVADPAIFSKEVVAGGSLNQGSVSFEALLYTPQVTINSGVTATLADGGTLQVSTANGTPSQIVNNGSLVIKVDVGARVMSNVTSGKGSVEKTGASLLKLSGVNTYSGGTKLTAGSLQMENAAALGSGSITFNGGVLVYDKRALVDLSPRFNRVAAGKSIAIDTNANDVVLEAVLKGDGGLIKTGIGNLTLAADDSDLLGPVSVAAGTLQLGTPSRPAAVSGDIAVSANATLRLANNSDTAIRQVISGAGTIETKGSGKVVLSGNNALFEGSVVLSNGILGLGSSNALGAKSSISFRGGTLQFGRENAQDYSKRISSAESQVIKLDTNGVDVRFDSVFGGTGGSSLVKMGAGTLTVTSNNAYTGNTDILGGALAFVGSQTGPSAVKLSTGNLVYHLSDGDTVSSSVTTTQLTESRFHVDSGGTADYAGSLTGAGVVAKQGDGRLLVSGKLGNSGGVSVLAGTLELRNRSVVTGAVSVAAGAVLDAVDGAFDASAALTLSGGLRIGASNFFIQKLTLDAGSITLVSSDLDAEGTIWVADAPVGTLFNGSLSAGGVNVRKFERGTGGGPTVVTGSFSGTVSGLPSGTSLTLQANARNKPVYLADSGMNLNKVTVEKGVDLRIDVPVSISTVFGVSGGSLTLSNAGNVTAVKVAIDGGATVNLDGASVLRSETNVSVGLNSRVVLAGSSNLIAPSLSVSGSSTVTLVNLNALQNIGVLEVGSSANTGGTLVVSSGTMLVGGGSLTQVLKGSGRIVGDVRVAQGSVVSPGNSPGMLTVGNLTMGPGTALVLEHGGTTAGNDVLQGGSVHFEPGSTIEVVDYNRSLTSGTAQYTPFNGVTVTGSSNASVVVAIRTDTENGLTGDPGVSYRKTYSAALSGTYSAGTISFTRNSLQTLGSFSGNLRKFASAANARQVTLATAQLAAGTFMVNAIDEIGSSSVSSEAARANLGAQLAAANPALYAELPALSFQRTLNLGQGVFDHFASTRVSEARGSENQSSSEELGFWSTTYGSWMKQNGSASLGTSGFSGNIWGEVFGVERRFGSLLLGVMGAWGQTSANFSLNPGSVSTDSWHGGIHASLDLAGTALETGVLYGSTDSRVRRSVNGAGPTSAEGRTSLGGTEWLLHVGLARAFEASPQLTITPSLRLMAQGEALQGASESSMNGLEISTLKQKSVSISHQAGLEVSQNFKLLAMASAMSLRAHWIHRYDSDGKTLDMQLGNDASTRASYHGSRIGADAVRFGTAWETQVGSRTSVRLSVDYQAQNRASLTYTALTIGFKF